MRKPKNAFEIFQFLDKSNCGGCGEKACLAFAGAVFLGQRKISECPRLSRKILELEGGRDRYPLFQKRCEEPMKRVADVYTPLFDDIVHVFGGKKVDKQFESDISVVLYPLPKVVQLQLATFQYSEFFRRSIHAWVRAKHDDPLSIILHGLPYSSLQV